MITSLNGIVVPKLIREKIFDYMTPRTRLSFYHDTENNMIKSMILEKTNLSKDALKFWTNVTPHTVKNPISDMDCTFKWDRLLRNLFKDFIWIMCYKSKDKKTKFPDIYFTDLIDVYNLGPGITNRYKRIRKKQYGHPSDIYRSLSKHNDLSFNEITFICDSLSDNAFFYNYYTDNHHNTFIESTPLIHISNNIWKMYKLSTWMHMPRYFSGHDSIEYINDSGRATNMGLVDPRDMASLSPWSIIGPIRISPQIIRRNQYVRRWDYSQNKLIFVDFLNPFTLVNWLFKKFNGIP